MDRLILADGTDTLSRNVGRNYQATQLNIAEKPRPLPEMILSTNCLLFAGITHSTLPWDTSTIKQTQCDLLTRYMHRGGVGAIGAHNTWYPTEALAREE